MKLKKALESLSSQGSSPLAPIQVAKRELKDYFNNLVNQYKYGNVKNPEWEKIYRGSFIYVDLPVENKKDLIVLKKGISSFGIIVESINDQTLKVQAAELVTKFNAWAAALEADFGASSSLNTSENVSSALTKAETVPTQMTEEWGGIDFTRINYLTQPMGSFQGLDLRLPLLSKAELEGMDINKELASVEQMINARIDVSTDRLKRLLAAMSQKDVFTSQRETQLLPLLLRLCWLKEEKGAETTPDFRAVLLIADTGLFVEQGNTKYSLN